MELKRVVVTGVGTINPLGKTVDEFFDNLLKGVSGAMPITRFDASNFKTQFACEVKKFDVTQYHPDIIDKKDARKFDPYTQFAMIAAHEVIATSGLDLSVVNLDEVGVVWASGIGGITTFYEEVKGVVRGDAARFTPFFVPKIIADIAAGHISMKYKLRGPNFATVSACASSTHAIISAFDLIRLGKAKAIVAGGSEAPINAASMGGFNSMMALSTNNENYATASRPFDKTRDGFVMGEGGAGIMLEEYEHAKARGAKIYAEMMGGGMTADAYHVTAPHPEGLGATNVMRCALKDAGMEAEEVDYINVHGTSTPIGDIAEIKAVENVFGEHAYKMNISSTKSMTGHLLGATGALEALACICAIQKGMVPPTINNRDLDPAFNPRLNLTLNAAQKRDVKVALSNTFGFGGHNASVIFRNYVG